MADLNNTNPHKHYKQNWDFVFRSAPLYIVPFILGLILFGICCGYNSSDPGWTSSGSTGKVAHWGGSHMAYLADFIFSVFGYGAYVLILGLIALPIYVYSQLRNNRDVHSMGVRWFCLLVCFVISCPMFALRFPYPINQATPTYGGLFGEFANKFLRTLFSPNKLMTGYTA